MFGIKNVYFNFSIKVVFLFHRFICPTFNGVNSVFSLTNFMNIFDTNVKWVSTTDKPKRLLIAQLTTVQLNAKERCL